MFINIYNIVQSILPAYIPFCWLAIRLRDLGLHENYVHLHCVEYCPAFGQEKPPTNNKLCLVMFIVLIILYIIYKQI